MYCSTRPRKLCDDDSCEICYNKSFSSHKKAKFWSNENSIQPREILKSSDKKYKFNCTDCKHIFESPLSTISRGHWCPYCSNKKLCNNKNCIQCYEKSFESHKKAKYWSPENKLGTREVFKSSGTKYKFVCKCNHIFETPLNEINRGNWCPYCATKKLCDDTTCVMCYNNSFASHPKADCWSDENIVSARQILKCSKKKIIFNCDCGHSIIVSPYRIKSDNIPCPFCRSNKLCDNKKCKMCFNNSFASHPRSKYWSDKNGSSVRDVHKKSPIKFIFNCECGHTFKKSPRSISKNKWCPYCSNQKLCNKNDCLICFKKSFASYPKSKYWSSKNKNIPRNVFKCSGKKFKFNCKCGHQIEKTLCSITSGGVWCSYCSNRKLCNKNDCLVCLKKSFASHPKSKYWSNQNEIIPRNVFKCSGKKFEFNCDICSKSFNIRLNSISKGHWCSCTVNKTETLLFSFLTKHFDITKQKKFDWCKDKNFLPFDFCIKKYKIIIELDGPQHFEQVSNWTSPEKTQQRDIYKMEQANKHGYTVIRLLQSDVWNDYNPKWKQQLMLAIHSYDKPLNIYLNLDFDQLVDKALAGKYLSMFLI